MDNFSVVTSLDIQFSANNHKTPASTGNFSEKCATVPRLIRSDGSVIVMVSNSARSSKPVDIDVRKWLADHRTPILWLSGPAGAGKTAALETALADPGASSALILRLCRAESDSCLAEVCYSLRRERPSRPVTTTQFLNFALAAGTVFLDAMDTIQQEGGDLAGEITDLRFRQLLIVTAAGLLPVAIVVTSRMAPPRSLPASAVTIVALLAPNYMRLPVPQEPVTKPSVLELVALSRSASDLPLLCKMSSTSERAARTEAQKAVEAGLLRHVASLPGGSSFQASDRASELIFADPARRDLVREAAISALEKDGSEPRRLLELLMDAGRVQQAVMVYWQDLGNFQKLERGGEHHFGMQTCRMLNSGMPPVSVSPKLLNSEGAWAVMNDWSQFALCIGDVAACADAAQSAYSTLSDKEPRWNKALLAAHVAEALLLAGRLTSAMEWAQRSWEHATEGMRQTSGIAVAEAMDAYDWAANTMARIYLRQGAAGEIRRLLDDLLALHEYGRNSVAEFDEASIIKIGGPTKEVGPEQLVEGRLSALLAFAEGRLDDVQRLTAVEGQSPASVQLRVLRLRANSVGTNEGPVSDQMAQLRREAEQRDDCILECELVAIKAQLTAPDSTALLAKVENYLARTSALGLGLYWRDLQIARSRALCAIGQLEAARLAAQAVLFGADRDPTLLTRIPAAANFTGAYAEEDWEVARRAVTELEAAGGTIGSDIVAGIGSGSLLPRASPRIPRRRRSSVSDSGTVRREGLHNAALAIIKDYEQRGMPFVLCFRKFDVEVLHGPMEFGPKRIENALRDALHPDVEVLTIQDHGWAYDLKGTRLSHDAPALFLEDENWEDVVRRLIPFADLIVSEPLMLSAGVLRELQMIYAAKRWDRTVLVLPPLNSPYQLVDRDAMIQMFPRCVWPDSLFSQPLTESPVITDLLDRIGAIASLSEKERCSIVELHARDKAYPVDLLPVAKHLELQATLGSLSEDDKESRYYGYWQMFRAAAIRGARYIDGDRSSENCTAMADSYLQMSNIMLDHTQEGETFILDGDPKEAELLVQSACGLMSEDADNLLGQYVRQRAEKQWEELQQLISVMAANPQRFVIRPRYGPLRLRAESGSQK